ncbi:MAG: amidohydrolase family protein [Thermoplasmata archaeon]
MTGKKVTIPLLHDHHAHLSGKAAYIDCVDLSDVEDKKRALSMIKEGCPEDEMNVVKGWNDSKFTLDQKSIKELPPVFIWNVSGHGLIFNERAEERFKEKFERSEIIEKMKDPEWVEKHLIELSKLMMKIEGIDERKLDRTYDFLLERGIYEVDDMLLPSEEVLDMIKGSAYEERWKIYADIDTYRGLSDKGKRQVEGIKLFADGALGTRTAAISVEYLDGSDGVLTLKKDELKRSLNEIKKDKFSIHAIGDRSIDMIVEAVSEMEKEGLQIPDIRIEHAQFIGKKTAELASSLDMTLSMQPNFSIDSKNYSDRLPENYLKKNNPFRMLIDEVGFVPGEDLIFGSDGLPYGVSEAVKNALYPSYEDQRLTLDELRRGYCIDSEAPGKIELNIDDKKEEVTFDLKGVETA